MPKTSKQLEEIKDRRRNSIIDASLKLFCSRGYATVTIDDICNKLKISHGLFYHYFSNKEELQNTIIQNGRSKNEKIRKYSEFSTATGYEYVKEINSLMLETLKGDRMACYYNYYFFMDNYFEKKKKKLPKLMNRILKEIKKGQDERKIIPGGPYEIFSLHTSLLLGIAVLNMKHQDNQFVPHDDSILNMFTRKEDTK